MYGRHYRHAVLPAIEQACPQNANPTIAPKAGTTLEINYAPIATSRPTRVNRG